MLEELLYVIHSLGRDEQRVLLFLAKRLAVGQRVYGKLNIAEDRRDWRKERAEELADASVYAAISEIASSLGAKK